jgi:hypothetical protein
LTGATIDQSTDQTIQNLLAGAVTALLLIYGLMVLVRLLRRRRPGLAIGVPLAIAATLRVLAAAGVSLTSIGSELRGGDEISFLAQSRTIADAPFMNSDWTSALGTALHKFVFALQIWILGSPEFVLRLTEIGIAVAGIAFMAAAVYELAGARAAVIATWLLALEPSGIFFSSLLHKESNMMLAEGLLAFGGARMWKRGDLTSLPIIVVGCMVGVATRPYAGWFLIAAGAAITLHAGLRTSRRGEVSSFGLIAIVILFAAIAAPTVWKASSGESLKVLQESQNANATDSSNLSLETVDFSSRGGIITHLPQRVWDLTFKPYPWQLGSSSQRIGAFGGLITIVLLYFLVTEILRRRGELFARAGPLIYLGFFLLIAYSLSTGNAGTGFRYRTHLLIVGVAMFATLREWRTAPAPYPEKPWIRPAPGALAGLSEGRTATGPAGPVLGAADSASQR